jgi:hypothetical protein
VTSGPGCYELRHGNRCVLFGSGSNVAARMSSLLPAPLGCGTRNNAKKRAYVKEHLVAIEYRTLSCTTRDEAMTQERQLRLAKSAYVFGT